MIRQWSPIIGVNTESEVRIRQIIKKMLNVDETELHAFFCRPYCPLSFYSMPLFLRGREKEEKGRVIATKK